MIDLKQDYFRPVRPRHPAFSIDIDPGWSRPTAIMQGQGSSRPLRPPVRCREARCRCSGRPAPTRPSDPRSPLTRGHYLLEPAGRRPGLRHQHRRWPRVPDGADGVARSPGRSHRPPTRTPWTISPGASASNAGARRPNCGPPARRDRRPRSRCRQRAPHEVSRKAATRNQ